LGGISRNAVIGKAHRLGLQGRPSPISKSASGALRTGKQAGRRRRVSAPGETALADLIARRDRADVGLATSAPSTGGEALNGAIDAFGATVAAELPARAFQPGDDGRRCVWPIGEPGDPEFRFCADFAVAGRPYCAKHCTVAYIRRDRTAA